MSSFARRIIRQQHPSQAVHYALDAKGNTVGEPYANNPRKKFFNGRGSQLGVKNPKCKSLAARLKREKRNTERSK